MEPTHEIPLGRQNQMGKTTKTDINNWRGSQLNNELKEHFYTVANIGCENIEPMLQVLEVNITDDAQTKRRESSRARWYQT